MYTHGCLQIVNKLLASLFLFSLNCFRLFPPLFDSSDNRKENEIYAYGSIFICYVYRSIYQRTHPHAVCHLSQCCALSLSFSFIFLLSLFIPPCCRSKGKHTGVVQRAFFSVSRILSPRSWKKISTFSRICQEPLAPLCWGEQEMEEKRRAEKKKREQDPVGDILTMCAWVSEGKRGKKKGEKIVVQVKREDIRQFHVAKETLYMWVCMCMGEKWCEYVVSKQMKKRREKKGVELSDGKKEGKGSCEDSSNFTLWLGVTLCSCCVLSSTSLPPRWLRLSSFFSIPCIDLMTLFFTYFIPFFSLHFLRLEVLFVYHVCR